MAGLMQYNKNYMSLREGKVCIDGVAVLDAAKCEVKVTPDVYVGKQLGDRTPSSRWLGATITGSLKQFRSTPWLKQKIKEYMQSGATPEFTFQGIMDDANSVYYSAYGAVVITLVGCVLTGDLPLTTLDSDGDVVKDSVSFNAKAIV